MEAGLCRAGRHVSGRNRMMRENTGYSVLLVRPELA